MSGDDKVAPLAKTGVTHELEPVPSVEVFLMIKTVFGKLCIRRNRDALVVDINAALVEQALFVPKRKRKPTVI